MSNTSHIPTPTDHALITPVLPANRRLANNWRGGLEAASVSATGTIHNNNEDSCILWPSADAPVFCAVADGVGGGAYGDVASSTLLDFCKNTPIEIFSHKPKIVDRLRQADAVVRNAIAALGTTQPGASTLVAAWFVPWGGVHIVNVGDCRAYRISPRWLGGYRIQQITLDQTYQNLGRQAPSNRKADDPVCMIGSGAVGNPKVIKLFLVAGELLLLCSDGLHKFVSDAELLQISEAQLQQKTSLQTLCQILVRQAKRNGSYDDVSALLIRRRRWFGAGAWYWVALLSVILGVNILHLIITSNLP